MIECQRCKVTIEDWRIHHINGDHGDEQARNKIHLCSKCHDVVQGICDKCEYQSSCEKKQFGQCWEFEDALPPIYFRSKSKGPDHKEEELSKWEKTSFGVMQVFIQKPRQEIQGNPEKKGESEEVEYGEIRMPIWWNGGTDMKAKGTKELSLHEIGKRLTMKQMILAKCCECMGKYADGKEDCNVPECPLYPMMPYGAIKRQAISRKVAPASSSETKEGMCEVFFGNFTAKNGG